MNQLDDSQIYLSHSKEESSIHITNNNSSDQIQRISKNSKKISKSKLEKDVCNNNKGQGKNMKGSSYIQKIQSIMENTKEDLQADLEIDLITRKDRGICTSQKLINKPKKEEQNECQEEKALKRQQARDTRKRKKIYIQLLEKKVKSLQDQIKQLVEKQTQQNHLTTMVNERNKLYEKLSDAINKEDESDMLNCIIDSLRLRLGIMGQTRLQTIQSFFNEIVNVLMPYHLKYLIWIASENLDIFSQETIEFNCKNSEKTIDSACWFSKIGLSSYQISEYKAKILQQKNQYDQILIDIDKIQKKIKYENYISQDIIDTLRQISPPINVAKFLLELDNKRGEYEKKKIYPKQIWAQICEQNNKQPILNDNNLNNQNQIIQQINNNIDNNDNNEFQINQTNQSSYQLSNLFDIQDIEKYQPNRTYNANIQSFSDIKINEEYFDHQ